MNIPTPSTVILTEQGIDLPASAMAGLPLSNNSFLWGAWIRASDRGEEPGVDGLTHSGDEETDHQLILTPLPPDTWPVSFCIQLQLSRRRDSLAYATRVIHALGLNILSVRAAPAGFNHSTVTLVCEAPELRRKAYHHTRSLRHSLSQSRVDLLGTGQLWPDGRTLKVRATNDAPSGPAYDVIDLTADQLASLKAGARAFPLDARQAELLEAQFGTRPLASATLVFDEPQAQALLSGSPVELSTEQSTDLFLIKRAVTLNSTQKDGLWRDFAFVLAEKLAIRMNEALWCLRLTSHFQRIPLEDVERFVRELVGRAPPVDGDQVPSTTSRTILEVRQDFQLLIQALKFVIDRVDKDREKKLERAFIEHFRQDRFDALKGIITNLSTPHESAGRRYTIDDFWEPNKTGFLHYRFLYGLEGFLISGTFDREPFGGFAGRDALSDVQGEGGQSLQRILNGIRFDGENEFIRSYEEQIGDLIDRMNELQECEAKIAQQTGVPEPLNVHQKLRLLLSIDARRRIAKAADGRLLSNLMYLWIRIRGDLVRVREFKYHTDRHMIVAAHRNLSESFPNDLDLPLPSRCIASVDSLQCVAKFFPPSPRERERIVRVQISYETRFGRLNAGEGNDASNQKQRPTLRTTGGILDRVTSAIETTGASILACSSQIRDRPRHLDSTERPRDLGEILVDIICPPAHQNLDAFISQVDSAIRERFEEDSGKRAKGLHGQRKVILKDLVVSRHGLTQVFISSRFADEFWRSIEPEIRVVCRHRGFEPCIVADPEAITEDILEKIRSSHCLLQIIPLLPGDGDLAAVNLSWILGEYMCASAREIPTVRAVQLDRDAKAQDWLKVLKVGAAQSFETFRTTTELLTTTLPRMLDRLRAKVGTRESLLSGRQR